MFERTQKDLEKAFSYCALLLNSRVYDPKMIGDNEVPKDIGVYLWRLKKTNDIVYVGQAIGQKGLYQRIVRQHLNKSYKGVLKEQIMAEFHLSQEQAVSYLEDYWAFSFIPVERTDKYLVNLVEALLINEFRPKYDRTVKYD